MTYDRRRIHNVPIPRQTCRCAAFSKHFCGYIRKLHRTRYDKVAERYGVYPSLRHAYKNIHKQTTEYTLITYRVAGCINITILTANSVHWPTRITISTQLHSTNTCMHAHNIFTHTYIVYTICLHPYNLHPYSLHPMHDSVPSLCIFLYYSTGGPTAACSGRMFTARHDTGMNSGRIHVYMHSPNCKPNANEIPASSANLPRKKPGIYDSVDA